MPVPLAVLSIKHPRRDRKKPSQERRMKPNVTAKSVPKERRCWKMEKG